MYWEFSEKGIVSSRTRTSSATPVITGWSMRRFTSRPQTSGCTYHGWSVPQDGAPVFLWFHGNAGNISHRLENLSLLHRLAEVQVFIFDYREYGKSEGLICGKALTRIAPGPTAT